MSGYRRLFLIADRELRHTPAMALAAALAERNAAVLHMSLVDRSPALATIERFDRDGAAEAREDWLEHRRRWLCGAAESLRARGVATTAHVRWAHPALTEIVAQIAALAPELVVKDLRRAAPLERPLLTPLDWQLLRACRPPLLLVHPAAPALPRRILAAIDPEPADGAESNPAIIRAALAVAARTDAELHLLHALAPARAPDGGSLLPAGADNGFIAHQRASFDVQAHAYGIAGERRHFLIAPAAEAIIGTAQALGADLIVIGRAHRERLDRPLPGSTAEQVLERLPCSLLAVRLGPAGLAPPLTGRRPARQVRAL